MATAQSSRIKRTPPKAQVAVAVAAAAAAKGPTTTIIANAKLPCVVSVPKNIRKQYHDLLSQFGPVEGIQHDEVVIESVNKLHPDYAQLRYWAVSSDGLVTNRAVYIPPNFELEIIDRPDLLEEYRVQQQAASFGHSRWRAAVGADPEIFIVDKGGTLLPAFMFLPNKEGSGGVYWDGYQAEFNTEPRTCLQEEAASIRGRLNLLSTMLPKGSSLTMKNEFEIPEAWLKEHAPEHTAFGCSPSLSAYDEERPELDGSSNRLRSAGGHIHLTLPDTLHKASTVQVLDAILGVMSVPMFRYWDSPKRRQYYGRAGEYRNTSYGLEYRVLSNAWLCAPVAFHTVYEMARRCVGAALDTGGAAGFAKKWMSNTSAEEVCAAINNCDVDMALGIISRNKDLFSMFAKSMPCGEKVFTSLVFNGFHTVLRNPDKPSSTWGIGTGGFGRGAVECRYMGPGVLID